MSLLGIFIVALIMAFAFSPYRRNNPLGPLLILFFILLLSGIAAHYWIVPFGPRFGGVYWFPVLIMMLAFGLLFSSPSPTPRRRMKSADVTPAEDTPVVIGLFIWVVLIILLIAVFIGMYHTSTLIVNRP